MTEQTAETPTETEHPGAYWLCLANETTDPLDMIGAALTGLLAIAVEAPAAGAPGADALASAHEQLKAAQAERNELENTLGEVLSACSKSKGQLAEKVRGVVLGQPEIETPASTPAMGGFVGQPTRDADIDAWRSYAREWGFTGPDVDQMNRSQIRTMLGLSNADA